MALVKIAEVTGKYGTAYVYRDSEWNEYRVCSQDKTSVYFTDDRSDALVTAKALSDNPCNSDGTHLHAPDLE